MSENTEKKLEFALKQIEKTFGKGALIEMGSKEIEPISSFSSGSLGLDKALGVGGFPYGRIVEIYGPQSSGKTTLALQAAAEVQKEGGRVAFIDAEHALDAVYAKNLGVDTDKLLISQPSSGEEALDITEILVDSGSVGLIIIDSVAALTPKAELDGEMGDKHVGLQARLMSQALRKLTAKANISQTSIIFINQIRMKIGTMGYGSPETTTGGNALKFYASIRIDVRRISSVKQGEEAIGNKVRARVIKNKVAPPFRQAEFEIVFGKGVSKIGEIIDYGVMYGIIDKAGAWFSYGDQKIGQGREKVKEWLLNNPELLEKIEKEVKEKLETS